jgi:hypothetical protein
MKNLIIVLSIFLASCSVKHKEDTQTESNEAPLTTDSIANQTAPASEFAGPEKAFYLASDFGLPRGTIKDFPQSDDYVRDLHDKGSSEPIYIVIIEPDGHIISTTCSYQAWITLHPGDKLY